MSWNKKVLVVDQSNEPVEIISWQKAITHVLLGKAELVIDGDPFEVRTSSHVYTLTTIIRELKYLYRKHRHVKKAIAFSRHNIFVRDNWTCLYCGEVKKIKDLTWDHVIPRAQGGPTTWENIATACFPCNQDKANRTPEQAGLTLLQKPYEPKSLMELKIKVKNMPYEIPNSWLAYLDPVSYAYWSEKLDS
jgi:5-methylcytosine-specific restriction endonuclease McrA